MRQLLLKTSSRNFFFWTYIATLFFSFHYFVIAYVNSSFIGLYVNDKTLGIIYAFGSVLTVLAFLNMARLLKRWGNYKVMLWLLVMEGLSIFGMAVFHDISWVVLAFIIHHAVSPMIVVSLDIFLEHYSRDSVTGSIRGVFLTILNAAAVICPFLIGFLLTGGGYRTIYLISVAFIFGLYLTVFSKFKNFRDSQYPIAGGIALMIKFLENIAVRQIFIVSLMLQIFYAWMIIYIPVYLFKYLHFSWPEIGLAISISLLPFVLFEIPVGRLEDKKYGEKEILMVGFVLMIGAVTIMGMINAGTVLLWTALLALARTGASFVEVSVDTYFFKQIDRNNDELVTFWRMTTPLGYIIGTLAGSVALIVFPFQDIFFVLTFILIGGVIYSFRIKDTR